MYENDGLARSLGFIVQLVFAITSYRNSSGNNLSPTVVEREKLAAGDNKHHGKKYLDFNLSRAHRIVSTVLQVIGG